MPRSRTGPGNESHQNKAGRQRSHNLRKFLSDLCCFYGGGDSHNEDIMHYCCLIPNHPPPIETRIWRLVVRALQVG